MAVQKLQTMRVYRKKSTFKGAAPDDFWYSATRSDGKSVNCVFRCEIPTQSAAFEIAYIKGQMKSKTVEVKGETYENITYYITSCEFYEIEGEDLEV